jgi:hypothetical protein
MDLNASVCVSVSADSEDEAIKKAEQAVSDFSSGFKLPNGEGYTDAVLFTSTEESAEVVDIED